jgi:hypothetical protein
MSIKITTYGTRGFPAPQDIAKMGPSNLFLPQWLAKMLTSAAKKKFFATHKGM